MKVLSNNLVFSKNIKDYFKNLYLLKNKKAVTLMEVVIAIVILAFTFIPIISTIFASARDTDTFNSYVFAQTTARNILDTLLDDVPFHSIVEESDHKASFVNSTIWDTTTHSSKTYDVTKINEMLASNSSNVAGLIVDERGTEYEVNVYVFPISNTDLKFTYLPRPKFGENPDWFTYSPTVNNSYCKNPTALISDLESNNNDNITTVTAEELGAEGDSSLKQLVVTMTWVGKDNLHRKIALYTIKANLDSER